MDGEQVLNKLFAYHRIMLKPQMDGEQAPAKRQPSTRRAPCKHQPEIPTPTVLAEGKKSMMNSIKH